MRRSVIALCSFGLTGLVASGCAQEAREFGNDRENSLDTSDSTSEAPDGNASGENGESTTKADDTDSTGGHSPAPGATSEDETTEQTTTSPVDTGAVDTGETSAAQTESPDTTEAAVTETVTSDVATAAPTTEPSDTGAPPADGPVHGRVIDFWGNPVPDLAINLDGEHATTNDDGEFTVDSAGDTYNVSFVVELVNPHAFFGWRFEHLTRRDPTLQVYAGLPEREATLLTTPNVELDTGDVIGIGIASENANPSTQMNGPTYLTPDWRGPAQTLANLHALWWSTDPTTELPTDYLGYFSTTIALTDTEESQVTLELDAGERIDRDNVSGNILYDTGVNRNNSVFVQFQDGATFQVVDDSDPQPSDFLYLVPSLPDASVIMAASEGPGWGESYAMAHKRGIAPGTLDVNLTLPTPPEHVRPIAGEDSVTWDTEFSWTLTGPNKVVVLHAVDLSYQQEIFVVTDRPTSHLPTFDNFELRKGGEHTWEVETHMECPTMDDCAGEDGFLDPLANAGYGVAKWFRDGSFTTSGTRGFVIAE